MTGKEEFYQLVEEGRRGHNIGLAIGSKKLETYMDGFLPGTSYLIGGTSGSGKSTYALWAFLYQPLINFLNGNGTERDPYWILFNLEMTKPQVYAKLISMYIFDNFGIELRFKEIFSRGADIILSDEHYNLIKQCDSFIDELDKRITCYDGTLTEEKYLNIMSNQLLRFGHWDNGAYYPNNPQQILGVFIDHVSLVKATSGRSKKDEMDAISRDSVILRNTTKIVSPIHVSQFNRSANSDERLKQSMQDPSANDFKDSGALYEDSQVVIALHSPHKFKLSTYKKYNIKVLEQSFIAIFLLKSRFGTSDIWIPFGFYGDCSHYAELPKPDEIYDYEKYKSPYYLLEKESEDDIKLEDEVNQTSKFIL